MNRSLLLPLSFFVLLPLACADKAATPAGDPAAPAKPAAGAQPAGLPDRDPALAKKLIDEGAVLLDVRTQQEWDGGHAPGAKLIPVNELSSRIAEVEQAAGGDKTKPVVVYCASGARSGKAKQMLLAAGFTQVTNVGGFSDVPK